MYSRPQHRRIQGILQSLNAELLRGHQCLFGGGTAIALSHGEYRESVDIDLLVCSVEGYRELRGIVSAEGVHGLLSHPLQLARPPRMDQYGIRCAIQPDDSGRPIKLEIVFEGRIQFAATRDEDRIDGVWTLAMEDKVATKLMANSDRWADDSVWSRDIIDLAVLTDGGAADPAGVAKAVHAYGPSSLRDFERARAHLLERDGWLARCMRSMAVSLPEAHLRSLVASMWVAPPHAQEVPGTAAAEPGAGDPRPTLRNRAGG